jgi:glutathione synthase/RimK-type ligase-like ATP-grasp enzyme
VFDDSGVYSILRQMEVVVEDFVWDDPIANPADYDALVFRSTSDYYKKPEQFAAFLDKLEASRVPVYNPVSIIRWNMDKHYLLDLAALGVNIVPTIYLKHGESASLEEVIQGKDWSKAVVKPAISAEAHQTWVTTFEQSTEHQSQLDEMLQTGSVLVQRYMPIIERQGETSYIFINGSFTHWMTKVPQQGEFRSQVKYGGQIVSLVGRPVDTFLENIQAIQAILTIVDKPLLYARVDGVYSDGEFYLMEMELIDPGDMTWINDYTPGYFATALMKLLST